MFAFFLGGGQHSNSKFLEPYGWDHDMYLIDSPCCFEKGFALLCFLQSSEKTIPCPLDKVMSFLAVLKLN